MSSPRFLPQTPWYTGCYAGRTQAEKGAPMNRFEKQVYECMHPTERLLAQTTNPLHRAILLNFWRHVHLEGAGEYEKILKADMVVEHPVYRVSWGNKPGVIE